MKRSPLTALVCRAIGTRANQFLSKTFLLFALLTCCFQFTYAQTKTVGGTVKNSTGEAMKGVSISAKGYPGGTTTNDEGRFSLAVPTATQILVFSYVGFEKQEYTLSGTGDIDVH